MFDEIVTHDDDEERQVPTPSAGDRAAYGKLRAIAARIGRERMGRIALDAGFGFFPLAIFLAALDTPIEDVFDYLRLDPGDLEESILWPFSPEGQADGDLTRLLTEGEVEGGLN